MALFSEEFAGWRDSDFDAFAEAKWRSNRFTPERTRVRLRLTAALERAVAQAELATSGLALWSSRQDPALINDHAVRALTVAWARPDAENVETAQIHAGIVVDAAGVSLRLCVPAALDEAWRARRTTLAELAALASMRVMVGGAEVTPETLALDEAGGELVLERTMSRAAAIGGLLTLDELAAWSGVVVPLLADLLGVPLQVLPAPPPPQPAAADVAPAVAPPPAEPEATATQEPSGREPPPRRSYRPQWAGTAPGRQPETAPVRLPQTAPGRPPQTETVRPPQTATVRPPIERILPPTWHPEPPRQAERPRHVWEPPRQQPGRQRPPEGHAAGLRPVAVAGDRGRAFELGPTPPRVPPASGPLAAGARVELSKGLFAGKLGTVAEISGEHLQVLLGVMRVRVAIADVRRL